jgi:hypothetical protein
MCGREIEYIILFVVAMIVPSLLTAVSTLRVHRESRAINTQQVETH